MLIHCYYALDKTLLEPAKLIQEQQVKNGNCVDWSSTSLNDKVESFYYQDSSCASIQFFQDKQCSGASLGTSTGSWQKIVTSAAGKTMSSAWIDDLGCYL